MGNNTSEIIVFVFHFLFIVYTILVILSYIILAIISAKESIEYVNKNSFVDYNEILNSNVAPSVSIIAPAYNESLNIVENVRSLLSCHYVNYDVIIVNDGSSDDSLKKLIKAYDLVKINYLINKQIQTKELREGVFKSRNPAFKNLTIIDKENGGKADALNFGLNVSKHKYVACIDVDCLLLEDAIQKMIKPFLEATDKKVIASGGVIRIANACVIKDGKLLDVNFPKKMIERAQILEYLRSFLLGRMAWSRLNGLLIISGAFGMFDKKVMIDVGGYDTTTVGEDMEIVVRMRKHMKDTNVLYRVAYIPDPLCWTEAPDSYKVLISQRNRWTRGTIETLKTHRDIGLNRKYKSLGLLSYPYWYVFERLAPLIEILGIVYLVFLILTERIKWEFAIAIFLAAYLFTVLYTLVAVFYEEFTFHQYKKKGTGIKLVVTAIVEPLIFHPFILYAALKGNIDFYFNKNKKWGKMTRKGLTKMSIDKLK